jgi:hypothetical protein
MVRTYIRIGPHFANYTTTLKLCEFPMWHFILFYWFHEIVVVQLHISYFELTSYMAM